LKKVESCKKTREVKSFFFRRCYFNGLPRLERGFNPRFYDFELSPGRGRGFLGGRSLGGRGGESLLLNFWFKALGQGRRELARKKFQRSRKVLSFLENERRLGRKREGRGYSVGEGKKVTLAVIRKKKILFLISTLYRRPSEWKGDGGEKKRSNRFSG